jgi:hypothetical protein
MSNDLNNNFEKLIRSKFEDYRTPVDPGSWNLIKKSLIKSRRIRYVYIAASFVAVAAATVLLLITLNRSEINDRKDNMAEQENRIAKKPENTETQAETQKQEVFGQIAKEAETEQEEHLLLQPVSNPVPVYNADIETLVALNETPEPRPDDPPFKERLQIVPQNISGASISLSSPNILRLSGNNTYPSLPENRKPGSKDNKKKDNSTQDNGNDMAAIPGKNGHDDRKWSVLMSFGAGNYQPSTISNRNSDLIMAAPILTSSNSTDYIRNRYKNEIMIPDNADTQHGLPLSAKFIVRKDLNSRWAVESGLNYTYLSTKYKWNKNTAKQHLHYLGIPLNVVYYVISKSNWNVYASAGGMVEKGIYSRIDRSDMTASKTNMKGLQWSVNGSVGMTYKLSRSVGMFFEPQAGYFFDNGQPESIRSEWPVSFGLGIGLRFSF